MFSYVKLLLIGWVRTLGGGAGGGRGAAGGLSPVSLGVWVGSFEEREERGARRKIIFFLVSFFFFDCFFAFFSSPFLHHGRPRRLHLVQQRREFEREPGAHLPERLEKGQNDESEKRREEMKGGEQLIDGSSIAHTFSLPLLRPPPSFFLNPLPRPPPPYNSKRIHQNTGLPRGRRPLPRVRHGRAAADQHSVHAR